MSDPGAGVPPSGGGLDGHAGAGGQTGDRRHPPQGGRITEAEHLVAVVTSADSLAHLQVPRRGLVTEVPAAADIFKVGANGKVHEIEAMGFIAPLNAPPGREK